MQATIPYIEQKFEEFNQQMFAGQLPKLPIKLSDAKTFLGVCAFKTRKGKDGRYGVKVLLACDGRTIKRHQK